MNIRKITGDKKEYIDLLLLADEQESLLVLVTFLLRFAFINSVVL